MENLGLIREEIDAVDAQIVTLYLQRMTLSEEVAAYKQAHDMDILDTAREEEKLDTVAALAGDGEAENVRALFTEIMRASRARQEAFLAKKA